MIALILLEQATGRDKAWLLAHGEYHLAGTEQKSLENNLNQLLEGIPLPYVIGTWDFFGRPFKVTRDVLIPRPETETLVELALSHLEKFPHPRILDVGTGSGAIAVSLSAEHPGAAITATDISLAALQVAKENARNLGQTGIEFILADLLAPIQAEFDLICANLPYIPSQTLRSLDVSRWEPSLALDGGSSGLALIQKLLAQSQTRISQDGMILLETEASLSKETLAAARAAFPQADCALLSDLAGKDRIIRISQ